DSSSKASEGRPQMKPNKFMHRLLMSIFIAALTVGCNAVAGQTAGGQTPNITPVPNGEKVKKHRGIVSKRSGDIFAMGDTTDSPQTVVVITPETKVKSHKKGLFRGSKNYEQNEIMRGLRLEVDGVGNAEGHLVAKDIRFDE